MLNETFSVIFKHRVIIVRSLPALREQSQTFCLRVPWMVGSVVRLR